MKKSAPKLNTDRKFPDNMTTAHALCLKAKNGEMIPMLKNARALKDNNGQLLGIVETVTDIRQLKCLELEMSNFKQMMSPRSEIGRLLLLKTKMLQYPFYYKIFGDEDLQ